MNTDQERARWEGAMETRMGDAERRLDAINGSIQTHALATNDLAVKMGALIARVSVFAGLGSVFGGALVAAVVKFLLNG